MEPPLSSHTRLCHELSQNIQWPENLRLEAPSRGFGEATELPVPGTERQHVALLETTNGSFCVLRTAGILQHTNTSHPGAGKVWSMQRSSKPGQTLPEHPLGTRLSCIICTWSRIRSASTCSTNNLQNGAGVPLPSWDVFLLLCKQRNETQNARASQGTAPNGTSLNLPQAHDIVCGVTC